MNRDRKPLIAGNWKMHHGGPSGLALAGECVTIARECKGVEIVIAPPFTALAACAAECHETGVGIAAQNCHAKDQGAFTGEVSAPMVKDAGCTWVILGHSERRQLFHETSAGVAEKLAAVLRAGLVELSDRDHQPALDRAQAPPALPAPGRLDRAGHHHTAVDQLDHDVDGDGRAGRHGAARDLQPGNGSGALLPPAVLVTPA